MLGVSLVNNWDGNLLGDSLCTAVGNAVRRTLGKADGAKEGVFIGVELIGKPGTTLGIPSNEYIVGCDVWVVVGELDNAEG
jgi:hypothetical protein